ncbi:flagellar assembly protein FliH [Filibacter tadaridae]|uniref:Flagellar assembly protein FliH n=1 Tax=Filibacter tadaridae TaxID=2483811 RepID=A0A3P5XM63_9BACL|nr:flagellar assembly protein FliH [Filibacter tadaridae]VDC29758.1 flagellar assembly protein H [Filibacter tadaridae]
MTSLSNVFRSHNTVSEEGKTREIGIRNLVPIRDIDPETELSRKMVLAERDKLLKEAQDMVEQEKMAIDAMRRTAADDIEAMHSVWQEEKTELQQKAYEEGFQIGYEEGRNKALSDMATSIQTANETTAQSLTNASHYIVSQERVILDLAVRTAERIIGQTLKEDEEIYLSVVKRALKETREMKEIKLYVSLDYFGLISDNRSELAAIFPPDVPFLIFANEDFDSTQCFIETNHGRIVVSIDEQLNVLRERLVEIMESGD